MIAPTLLYSSAEMAKAIKDEFTDLPLPGNESTSCEWSGMGVAGLVVNRPWQCRGAIKRRQGCAIKKRIMAGVHCQARRYW